MNVVIFQRSIAYIIAMFYGIVVNGFKIQHRGQTDHGGHNVDVVLTSQTKDVEFGKNLSLICKAEHACMVNSWSVKEQNGTYETIVRESTPFNRTRYGAHLNKMERRTIYELIIYRLDKNDMRNDCRCDCDTSSGYLTAMNDNTTMRNNTKKTQVIYDTKKTQDLSQNNEGFMSLGIGGILILF